MHCALALDEPALQYDGARSGSPVSTGTSFTAVPVPSPAAPTCSEQIAAVLGAIDDLIENNRRRVEVLEEMARAIYREWFVHFRFPATRTSTLVDSALGPIPRVGRCDLLAAIARQRHAVDQWTVRIEAWS